MIKQTKHLFVLLIMQAAVLSLSIVNGRCDDPCTAPCTWITTLGCDASSAAPVTVDDPLPDPEFQGILQVQNAGAGKCPLGIAPSNTYHIEYSVVSTLMYKIDASASWNGFGLTASCATNLSVATIVKADIPLIGFCAAYSADIAKHHARTTYVVTFNCGNFGTSTSTRTLDTYTLYFRSPVPGFPKPGCKTSCQNGT